MRRLRGLWWWSHGQAATESGPGGNNGTARAASAASAAGARRKLPCPWPQTRSWTCPGVARARLAGLLLASPLVSSCLPAAPPATPIILPCDRQSGLAPQCSTKRRLVRKSALHSPTCVSKLEAAGQDSSRNVARLACSPLLHVFENPTSAPAFSLVSVALPSPPLVVAQLSGARFSGGWVYWPYLESSSSAALLRFLHFLLASTSSLLVPTERCTPTNPSPLTLGLRDCLVVRTLPVGNCHRNTQTTPLKRPTAAIARRAPTRPSRTARAATLLARIHVCHDGKPS